MKWKTITGASALLVAGVCIAIFANMHEHSTWLLLIAGALLTYVFLKCFSTKELEKIIRDKLGSRITPIAIVLLIMAEMMMPSSLGELVSDTYYGILYFVSYAIWICGLYLLAIKNDSGNKRN